MDLEIQAFFRHIPTHGTDITREQMLKRIKIHSQFLIQIQKEFKNGVYFLAIFVYLKSNHILMLDKIHFLLSNARFMSYLF